jgi:hypothetical protein
VKIYLGGIVATYPAHFFFSVMSWFLTRLLPVFSFFLFAGSALINAGPEGFVEGHLKIIPAKEVELADETASKMTLKNYVDYPLVILSRDKKTEVTHVTADESGNYRIALPPGDYILDCQNRHRRHFRATPQPFTVVANQTVQVDMAIDTGIR